jgi:uncharacterized hydantoinase/oxoprolinase family protein
MIPVIGLDVGGANTKAAVVDAAQRMRIVSEPSRCGASLRAWLT